MPTPDPLDVSELGQSRPEPDAGVSPLRVVGSAFLWAAGGYALAMAAGVVLCVLLAISGPAFSISTPLFTISALHGYGGKMTSFHVNGVPFCLAAAACGAAVASLRSKVTARRARRR